MTLHIWSYVCSILYLLRWSLRKVLWAVLEVETWNHTLGCLRGGDVWGTTPSCLMWCIWEERNCRTFEGKELSLPNLKFLLLKTLYKRSSISYTFSTFSFTDFLDDSFLSLSLGLCNFISSLCIFFFAILLCTSHVRD